jgi:hypothetical protein
MNILNIGTGGAGNKLLDSFMDVLNNSDKILESVYDGVFINSNGNEMKRLNHYNPTINGLIINGGGTGRDQDVAQESISKDKSKFINFFANKTDIYDVANVYSSGGGGFGAGSISTTTNVLRQLNPNLAINLVIAMPSLSEGKTTIKNALKLHSKITKLRVQGIINSYQYIDNDKMEDEETFNKQCMQLILDSYELQEGAVDISDTKIINSANKYKVILPLMNKFKSLVDAVDYAMDHSPFVMPNNLDCAYLGGIFVKGEYVKDEWRDLFKAKMWGKTDYGTKNLMVLGGTSTPDEYIQTLQEAYDNMKDDEDTDQESIFEFKEDSNNKKQSLHFNNSNNQKNTETKKSLRDLMNGDFWS